MLLVLENEVLFGGCNDQLMGVILVCVGFLNKYIQYLMCF